MISCLQSIRFILALMIFHHHFFANPQIIQFGTFPVSFFFILSGFVMTIGYGEKVQSSSFNYKEFILKRIFKIVPLNTLCLLLFLAFPVLTDLLQRQFYPLKYDYILLDLLLIQSWIPIKSVYFSGNSVSWFLSSIVFCYLMFPILMKLLNAKLMALILFIYFIVIEYIPDNYIHPLIYINPAFRIIDFALGIVLCFCLQKFHRRDIKNPLGCTILEFIAISIVIITIFAYQYVPSRFGLTSLYWMPSLLLIGVFAHSRREGGVFSKLLEIPIFVKLGALSFPFYMIHTIIISWFNIFKSITNICISNVYGAVICILIATMFAYIYVTYIEPIIYVHLKRRLL